MMWFTASIILNEPIDPKSYDDEILVFKKIKNKLDSLPKNDVLHQGLIDWIEINTFIFYG